MNSDNKSKVNDIESKFFRKMTEHDSKTFMPEVKVVTQPDTSNCETDTAPAVVNTDSSATDTILNPMTYVPVGVETDPCVEILSLDSKSSTAFCKICHSGESSERLLQPCFCKGNPISFFVENDVLKSC